MIVVNARRTVRVTMTLLAVVLLITFVNIADIQMIQVFETNRELPIYGVQTNENKVSLTFDCAWGAGDIPDILRALKKYEAKATFFVVGHWVEKYPEAVKMIVDEGHEIGSHGYSHLRMSKIGSEKIKSEIELTEEVVEKITGRKMNLFRPPYGDYSNQVVRAAKEKGYFSIQWNVDSLDWMQNKSREDIVSRVLSKTDKGSIILMHNDTKYTAQVLPDILEGLRKKGFTVVSTGDLILKENFKLDDRGIQIRKE